MYLFFDTETSDLPADFLAPETDTQNWPHMIQIAWIMGASLDSVSAPQVALIRPEGYQIAPGAFECHGISTAYATRNGVSIAPVIDRFLADARQATTIVAHNIEFDTKIIGAECARLGIANPLSRKTLRCTMRESIEFCQLPSNREGRQWKWPTQTELHTRLFGVGFENAHDATHDCLACMRCFFRLLELGVM